MRCLYLVPFPYARPSVALQSPLTSQSFAQPRPYHAPNTLGCLLVSGTLGPISCASNSTSGTSGGTAPSWVISLGLFSEVSNPPSCGGDRFGLGGCGDPRPFGCPPESTGLKVPTLCGWWVWATLRAHREACPHLPLGHNAAVDQLPPRGLDSPPHPPRRLRYGRPPGRRSSPPNREESRGYWKLTGHGPLVGLDPQGCIAPLPQRIPRGILSEGRGHPPVVRVPFRPKLSGYNLLWGRGRGCSCSPPLARKGR